MAQFKDYTPAGVIPAAILAFDCLTSAPTEQISGIT